MKPRPHFDPKALEDIDEIAEYIAKDSIRAALRFYSAVESSAELLAAMPGAGPLYEFKNPSLKDVHFWPIKSFRNFLIFYRPRVEGGVEIIRVLHGAMDVPREIQNR